MEKGKFEPEVIWVVYDDGNDMPIVGCYAQAEAEALAAMLGDTFINAKPVPMVEPLGTYPTVLSEVTHVD